MVPFDELLLSRSVDVPFARSRVGTDVRFTLAPGDGAQGARAGRVHSIQS